MSLALDARRLFRAQQHATLGTLSTALAGYPYCSVVPYVLDHQACPIILVSRLAEHTHNIDADPRVCLFAHEAMPDVQMGSRATLMGNARRIDGPDPATDRYVRYFPQARTYKDTLDFEYYASSRRHYASSRDSPRCTGSAAKPTRRPPRTSPRRRKPC
jgi:heme iron utilization protein